MTKDGDRNHDDSNSSKSKLSKVLDEYGLFFLILFIVIVVYELLLFLCCSVYSWQTNYYLEAYDLVNVKDKPAHSRSVSCDSCELEEFKKFLSGMSGVPVETVHTRYDIKAPMKENGFPLNGCLALAVCVPLAILFLILFVFKMVMPLFGYEYDFFKTEDKENLELKGSYDTVVKSILGSKLLNIYTVAGLVFIFFFLFWLIPHILVAGITDSLDQLYKFRWVVGFLVGAGVVFYFWRSFLAYRLNVKVLHEETEVRKDRNKLLMLSEDGKGKKMLVYDVGKELVVKEDEDK